jgi:glycosyltransferase involved in cell wall biosynthesis
MNENIQVLMSTYNGEKYLRNQIDSILSQENVNVSILVVIRVIFMLMPIKMMFGCQIN